MSAVKVAAIIPARMGSSRFPGKPLLEIQGLPMVEHVRRRVEASQAFSDVVVATCDKEIEDCIKAYGGKVMMTAPTHPGATDRVAEAASKMDCTHVVNVQGDEILILPTDLKNLVSRIKENPSVKAWNAVAPITDKEQLSDSSLVKTVLSQSKKLLYCSRNFSLLPFTHSFEPIHIVLGILAYEKSFLFQYGKMSRTPGELLEGIDQNRIVESDIALQGLSFSKWYPGINEPRERVLVDAIFNTDQAQKEVLATILKGVHA